MISIDFEFDTKYGKYSDAIFVEGPMSDDEIENEKQRRLANWISHIENPPIETISES